MTPHLSFIIRVTADAALTLVGLPLSGEAPAVNLVIIEIGRIVEAISPHRGS